MDDEILYIEDNEQNLYLITFLLESHGYKVVQARNGREGIELALEIRPALILMDIQLPVMDGYEVLRRIKEKPEIRDISIVALTSYAMAGDRERALEAGCAGYIEKPIMPDTFMAQIEPYLPARPTADGGEQQ
jgi:CheY-like chemotaxis protein